MESFESLFLALKYLFDDFIKSSISNIYYFKIKLN